MDDFGCGTSPAGHSAVVLAPGRGFGYPGTDRSAWPGHIGRHGAVAGRRAGVGGAVHSGRQASGRAWPTHGAGPSGECLGRWAGFRGRWAGLQRRWQHFFFLGGLWLSTFFAVRANSCIEWPPPRLPCPTPRANAARGFNRLQGLVEVNPLSTDDHHGGPRSSVFGVPANQRAQTSSGSPDTRPTTELRHRGAQVPSGARRQGALRCSRPPGGSRCARTEDGLLAAPCCCGRSTEPDATWRSRFSVV